MRSEWNSTNVPKFLPCTGFLGLQRRMRLGASFPGKRQCDFSREKSARTKKSDSASCAPILATRESDLVQSAPRVRAKNPLMAEPRRATSMSARETPTARMGATTSMNIVTLEATDEDSAVRASTPPSALCRAVPFRARESYLLVFLHHFRHSRPALARRPADPRPKRATRSQPPDPSPFVIMRRADGRAFVIDAAGSAEITDASSAFLRALASAGTAPPRVWHRLRPGA